MNTRFVTTIPNLPKKEEQQYINIELFLLDEISETEFLFQ